MRLLPAPAPAWGRLALAIWACWWTAGQATSSIPMIYCASINTASMAANESIYQSDGLCHNYCQTHFALAIVQGTSCWCSNIAPDSSKCVSVGQCSNPCPGFPSDVCGGDGLFGYMLLNSQPTGTAATGQSASATSTSPGSSTVAPTVQTVTAGGTVKTVTVTPTPAAGAGAADDSPSSDGGSGLSTGAAVGLAVGIVAGVAILAGIGIIFFLRRRHREGADGDAYDSSPSVRNSSTGMMNTPKTDMSESRYAVGPEGRRGSEVGETDTQGRRRSKLMPVDPRMDPFGRGIYAREENKSHDSVHTLRDDQDYSRRVHEPTKILRAVNPDPVHDD